MSIVSRRSVDGGVSAKKIGQHFLGRSVGGEERGLGFLDSLHATRGLSPRLQRERERESERERERVCVCVRERECVCVCVSVSVCECGASGVVCVCVCMCERERESGWVCVRVRESECGVGCVCVRGVSGIVILVVVLIGKGGRRVLERE